MSRNNNYSNDRDTMENSNRDDRYDITGESEYSRESTIPFDEDEVLSERHYSFDTHGKEVIRRNGPFKNDFRGKGPKGYRKSDEAVKEDVSEALYRSTEVDASYIEVFVKGGHVTLKGKVASREQKKSAESCVEYVSGVIDVYNELHIAKENFSEKVSKYGLIQNTTGLN